MKTLVGSSKKAGNSASEDRKGKKKRRARQKRQGSPCKAAANGGKRKSAAKRGRRKGKLRTLDSVTQNKPKRPQKAKTTPHPRWYHTFWGGSKFCIAWLWTKYHAIIIAQVLKTFERKSGVD